MSIDEEDCTIKACLLARSCREQVIPQLRARKNPFGGHDFANNLKFVSCRVFSTIHMPLV